MATQQLDLTQVLTGYRGELWSDDTGKFLAYINTWHASFTIANTDYQPAGQALRGAIFNGYHLTLVFTETVVQDEELLNALNDSFIGAKNATGGSNASGKAAARNFNFHGTLERADGSEGQYNFKNCVPDGTIDVANIVPGDLVNRAWNFRVNSPLSIAKALPALV